MQSMECDESPNSNNYSNLSKSSKQEIVQSMKDQVPIVLLNKWLQIEPEKSHFAKPECCAPSSPSEISKVTYGEFGVEASESSSKISSEVQINMQVVAPKRGVEAGKRKSMIPQIDQENKVSNISKMLDLAIKIGAQVGRRMTWLNKDKNFNSKVAYKVELSKFGSSAKGIDEISENSSSGSDSSKSSGSKNVMLPKSNESKGSDFSMIKVETNSKNNDEKSMDCDENSDEKEDSLVEKRIEDKKLNDSFKECSIDSRNSEYSDLAVHPLQSAITVKYNQRPPQISKLLSKHYSTPTRTRTHIIGGGSKQNEADKIHSNIDGKMISSSDISKKRIIILKNISKQSIFANCKGKIADIIQIEKYTINDINGNEINSNRNRLKKVQAKNVANIIKQRIHECNSRSKLTSLRTFDTLVTEKESAVAKKMREKLIILNSCSSESLKRSAQRYRHTSIRNWSPTELPQKNKHIQRRTQKDRFPRNKTILSKHCLSSVIKSINQDSNEESSNLKQRPITQQKMLLSSIHENSSPILLNSRRQSAFITKKVSGAHLLINGKKMLLAPHLLHNKTAFKCRKLSNPQGNESTVKRNLNRYSLNKRKFF